MVTSTAVRPGVEQGQVDDRDPVLDAALAAFLDFGIRRTSMGEIARRAGISPATLYRRYAAKSDVVMAVGLREATRDIATIDARVDTSAPPEEQLTQMYLEVSRRVRGNKLLRRVLDTEPETVLPGSPWRPGRCWISGAATSPTSSRGSSARVTCRRTTSPRSSTGWPGTRSPRCSRRPGPHPPSGKSATSCAVISRRSSASP